jgi:GT2 family glycosyltransferase
VEDPAGIRVVVVTHRSAGTIGECLRRLLLEPEATEIVVVDNGSDDGTVAVATPFAQAQARVTLRADSENPGFAVACNAAAAGCRQAWLAFVNPDCYVEPETLARLLAHASGFPDTGAIGCVQVDENGVEDPAVRRRDLSLRRVLFAGGARVSMHVGNDGSVLQSVEAISGAMILVPTAVFERVGGFDPGYRLHVEDLDLFRRIRAEGFAIRVANDVRVIHVRGVSSRRRPLWVEWQKHRGMWRYFRKFEAERTALPMRMLLWAALWGHFFSMVPRAWVRVEKAPLPSEGGLQR